MAKPNVENFKKSRYSNPNSSILNTLYNTFGPKVMSRQRDLALNNYYVNKINEASYTPEQLLGVNDYLSKYTDKTSGDTPYDKRNKAIAEYPNKKDFELTDSQLRNALPNSNDYQGFVKTRNSLNQNLSGTGSSPNLYGVRNAISGDRGGFNFGKQDYMTQYNPTYSTFSVNPIEKPQEYANGGELYDTNLPQYGMGDWLQKNAGTIGMVGGLAASFIPGGAAIAPLIGMAGNKITQNYEQGEAADAQMESMEQQQQAQQHQNQVNMANQQIQNNGLQQTQFAGTNSFAMGGPLANNKNGSQGLTSYNGATHQNGGINVDAQGSPSAISGEQPVGEVENGEKSYTNKDGKVYIFSNRLNYE